MNGQLKLEDVALLTKEEILTKVKGSYLPQVYKEQIVRLEDNGFETMAKLTQLIQYSWEKYVKTGKTTEESFILKFKEIHNERIGKLTEIVAITVLIDDEIAKAFLKYKA
jgi:hypothetical protein